MADSKKYDGSAWEHSLRKLTTATETIQSGDTIYADGTAITTYTLKGNEEHTGTPSPQNPVMPNGVGERSANLVSMSEPQGDGYLANSVVGITGDGRENIISTQAFFVTEYIPVSEGTYYYYSDLYRATANNAKFMFYNANKEFIGYANRQPALEEQPVYELSSFSAPANAAYMRMNIDKSSTKNCLYTSQLPSYEPYGQYKIPISSGGQTTNIYLGSTQTVRQIYKYVCTGDENWTNNFGASLFMVQGIFNSAPFIPQVDSLSTHYSYKPIQSGFGAGLSHGQYALQRSGTQQQYGYNIALKNTDYTDTTNFKAYLQAQYAAGTPVTVWYVLATPQTAAVNEPLMKIGDYADTLSNAASIPTTEGANSISVDTTVQPSEFTATWTGWHDASVQEWDGSQWNE